MPGNQQSVASPFFHNPQTNIDDAARAYWTPYTFVSGGATAFTFQDHLDGLGLFTLQQLYGDNSLSPAPSVITIGLTRQVITLPPFSQGFYRVLSSPAMLDFAIVNNGGTPTPGFVINLHWINIRASDEITWIIGPP